MCGEKRKALDPAKVYRDNLIATLNPLTRAERCWIKKKNNRLGVSGVTRVDTWEMNRGRRSHRRSRLAQWPIEVGKARIRKFSIKRYGERRAFQLALRAKLQALTALPKRA